MNYQRHILPEGDRLIQCLTPTVAMEELLRTMQDALTELAHIPTPTQSYTYDRIPEKRLISHFARLQCIERGFQIADLGDSANWLPDLFFHMQNELGEVSRQSLKEKIEKAIDLNVWGQHYRMILTAASVQHLLRDEPGTLWSLFAYQHQPIDQHLIHRYRSFVDFFRYTPYSWQHVRFNELSYACFLFYGALRWNSITDATWLTLTQKRLATEILLRYNSWNDLAASILLTNTFRSLYLQESYLTRIVDLSIQKLRELLQATWLTPWPTLA